MTKRLPILILTILTLSLSVVACSSDESKADTTATATSATATHEAPPLPSDVVEIAAATKAATDTAAIAASGDANAFEATGEFVSPVRSELSPKLPGRVAKLYVDEGQRVTRGQPVLVLENDYARLNLQTAEA